MAAAMRAKQPGSEATQSKPESAKKTPNWNWRCSTTNPPTSAGDKPAESRRTESGRPLEPDAREKLAKAQPWR